MRPEGSRRAIGVICTEVALPVDEDGQYACARYDRTCHRTRSDPACSRLLGGATTGRAAARLVAPRRADVQRWTKLGTPSALCLTCVRRPCGKLSRRTARIIYDCKATGNGTTFIEHCGMRVYLAGVSCVGKTTIGAQLAGLLVCRFFDLDIETERFFETSIERLRNRHLTSHDFRLAASQALKCVLSREDSYDWVIALPPSGLLGGLLEGCQRNAGRHHCRAARYAGEYPQEDHVLRHRLPPAAKAFDGS
jgi:hypothetical protein